MGCCKKEKNSSVRRTSCVTLLCRIVLFIILLINTVWGFTETITAVIVNYLINHPAGPDGFSNSKLEIRDITYIERRPWDNVEAGYLEEDANEEREHILKLRKLIVTSCTRNGVIKDSFQDQACNTANEEERKYDYFCAVVEHPERYHTAFRPLVFRWLVYNCFFMMTIPIKLVSTCWTSQALRLLGLYMLLQIIPIVIAASITFTLFPVHLDDTESVHVHELCALDYLHEGIPVRLIYGVVIAIRFGLKVIEAFCILWYIYTYKAEKRRLALGMPVHPTMRSGRVAPEMKTLGGNPLEPMSPADMEAALTFLEAQVDPHEVKQEQKVKRLSVRKEQLPETLSMDAILPEIVSPSPSRESIAASNKNQPPSTSHPA